jgi:hypothetical protein
LMRRENFVEKFSAALGFLSCVIAFLSSLIVTMIWLHYSAPLGLNVNVSSFTLMLSFMIPAATSIVALAVLKNETHKKMNLGGEHADLFKLVNLAGAGLSSLLISALVRGHLLNQFMSFLNTESKERTSSSSIYMLPS